MRFTKFLGCFDKIIHTPCLRTGEDVVQALRGLEGEVSERQLGKLKSRLQILAKLQKSFKRISQLDSLPCQSND